MRIVVDLQGAQTESRFRGIGRYTLSFTQALIDKAQGHEVFLALNGNLPEGIPALRETFRKRLPPENIRVWQGPGNVAERDYAEGTRRRIAERIRESFLASLSPDIVHIPSLFEGFVDDAVTSVGVYDQRTPTMVTVHDLIPLMNRQSYLATNPCLEAYYLRKIEHLKRSHGLLAISDSSAREARDFLGIPEERIWVTGEGLDPAFEGGKETGGLSGAFLAEMAIHKPFILYTGGGDQRKNLKRLVRAYGKLSESLRARHQLVFAGELLPYEKQDLWEEAMRSGIQKDELVFTGYVSDSQLAGLYRQCELFVLPSWQEGFGLPALEAMASGAPVIGANASSIPELVVLSEALFDPFKEEQIRDKMEAILSEPAFRERVRLNGFEQAKRFSWDAAAEKAWVGLEETAASFSACRYLHPGTSHRRPKLAFASPVPPQKSGISEYSAELLPFLNPKYDITLVVDQCEVDEPWIRANLEVISPEEFRARGEEFDRVLYHLGNAPFHYYMVDLLKEVPGVVVLHDFYLSDLLQYMENYITPDPIWTKNLLHSHGYKAVYQRLKKDKEQALLEYSCNLFAIQEADAVIVHSEYARKLADEQYGAGVSRDWFQIPHLRAPEIEKECFAAREELGIPEEAFVACSFGMVGPNKRNHELVEAWLSSSLANLEDALLFFVGESPGGSYDAELIRRIQQGGGSDRIKMTGWVDRATYKTYLAAADVGVQLRRGSRGETSGTVLDCMNFGLATVLNAHGPMAEVSREAIWMLDDDFQQADLAHALETLYEKPGQRQSLGELARSEIRSCHDPGKCAELYYQALEQSAASAFGKKRLVTEVSRWLSKDTETQFLRELSQAIAANELDAPRRKNLFVDVTGTACNDLQSGVERVAKAFLWAWIEHPPTEFRVEPVYLSDENGRWHYRFARSFTLDLMGCPAERLSDEVSVAPQSGDYLVGLDISGQALTGAWEAGLFTDFRNRGCYLAFMIHDVLPLTQPSVFPPGADRDFKAWLKAVGNVADKVVCPSRAVAKAVQDWLANCWGSDNLIPEVHWSHHGADFQGRAPTSLGSSEEARILERIVKRPTFLMVGTVEPRKRYPQALQAFERLLEKGLDVNLVIVGQEGWRHLPPTARRDIPCTVDRLRRHPDRGKRLFWLAGISDEFLARLYEASSALLVAAHDEGFGLPLIEAAMHNLPIIARDLPVFREIAGDQAYYFAAEDPHGLAESLEAWLVLFEDKSHPRSEGLPILSWQASAANFLRLIGLGEAPEGNPQERLDPVSVSLAR